MASMNPYLIFILGIILLVKGADYLINGSSALAKRIGIPSLVIGLTVVAFGTSMPELVVNIFSAIRGETDIALGNIIGSNMSNILLILGGMAAIYPFKMHYGTIWREIPFNLFAVLILVILVNDSGVGGLARYSLTRMDGFILLLFFLIFIYYLIELTRNNNSHIKIASDDSKKANLLSIILMILGGAAGLYFGGKFTVDGAVFVARKLELSEFLISATVIAVGTSLPELVTSIKAAIQKNIDIAVGNIIGSNVLNILWILGITSIITPIAIPSALNIDLLFLIAATILLFLFLAVGRRHKLDRWQGSFLVSIYVTYIIFLFIRG